MNRIKALLCAYDALLCEAESAKSSKQRVEAINTADVFREEISQLIAAEVETSVQPSITTFSVGPYSLLPFDVLRQMQSSAQVI